MAEKKIGKHTFKVDQLNATRAVSLMFRLGNVAGGAMAKLAKAAAAPGDPDEKRDAILTAVGEALSQTNPETAQGLLVDLCACAQVQMPQGHYEPVVFDAVFEGEPLKSLELAAYVVQVNFGDFFADA